MNDPIKLSLVIPEDLAGTRVDRALALLLPDYSRSRIKTWLDKEQILLNGFPIQPKYKLQGGEKIELEADLPSQERWSAQDIALEVIYEDNDILVINKPANLVVHPAAGNLDGTLVNALLHHAPVLNQLPRAGLIHRIDKDTTGLLLIAKSLIAHTQLVQQLQERSMKRQYEAIVYGHIISGGTIDQPIGRHPKQRTKMAIIEGGRPSVTHYRVAERFDHFTRLTVSLETGRTHQIRVHMEYLQHTIVGDKAYDGRIRIPAKADIHLINALKNFPRQALHAFQLSCMHPVTQEIMTFNAPLPSDMQQFLEVLRQYDNSDL